MTLFTGQFFLGLGLGWLGGYLVGMVLNTLLWRRRTHEDFLPSRSPEGDVDVQRER